MSKAVSSLPTQNLPADVLDTLPGAGIAWLDAVRQQALARFSAKGFPDKKTEAWKYTSLRDLPQTLLVTQNVPPASDLTLQDALKISYSVVFSDGVYQPQLSTLPNTKGVVIAPLSECLAQTGKSPATRHIQTLLEAQSTFNAQPHVALNTAYASDGVVCYIAKGIVLDRPLDIHYVIEDTARQSSYTQLFIILEDDAQATVIERFYGQENASSPYVCHHVARLDVGANASLNHYRLQQAPGNVRHIYAGELNLRTRANYEGFWLGMGAALSRQELHSALNGQHSNCQQRGIILGQNTQHHDTYLPVSHNTPNSHSLQHFRQVLDDQSRGIFYGHIQVPKACPKSESHQLNHNILLAKTAQAFSRPELDILTDDVICSHGATIGNLDEQALYYLQTRGLSARDAKSLLVQGFLNAMLDEIPNEQVRQLAAQALEQWSTSHQLIGGGHDE